MEIKNSEKREMNKKKLIIVMSLLSIVALSSFMLFKEVVVRGGVPEWGSSKPAKRDKEFRCY